jgi:hypothetical protein
MLKTFVFLMTITFSGYATSGVDSPFIEVMYSGFKLKIPASPLIIGHLGGKADSLVVKYSKSPGSRYVGFTNDHDLYTGSCIPEVFFEKVVAEPSADDCDGAVKAFQKVFSKDSDVGVWTNSKMRFYYFIDEEKSSFVFLISDDGSVVKMESDFLKKYDFEKALSSYL